MKRLGFLIAVTMLAGVTAQADAMLDKASATAMAQGYEIKSTNAATGTLVIEKSLPQKTDAAECKAVDDTYEFLATTAQLTVSVVNNSIAIVPKITTRRGKMHVSGVTGCDSTGVLEKAFTDAMAK